MFHRVKEDFEEIKVVWKNPGVVALYAVMVRRDEVKCEGPSPSILPQTMSWNPGAEKAPLSFLLLGVVDGHVVIENDKQEERHAQHVGEDGELHVRDHTDQLGSAATRSANQLEAHRLGPRTSEADHSEEAR